MTMKKIKKEKHMCGNCGRKFDEDSLLEPKHLWQRLLPGDTFPSGECPKCGALCYPVECFK
jgi:hypothetical protein